MVSGKGVANLSADAGGGDCAGTDESCRLPTEVSTDASGMEFLPLMATSVYCAVGLVWAFMRLSLIYLRQTEVSST